VNDSHVTGERLSEGRKRRGLTQGDLAQSSGVSLSLIKKLEQGVLPGTRMETFRKIAVALRVPTSRLLAEREAVDDSSDANVDLWEPVRHALEGRFPDAEERPTVEGVRATVDDTMPLFSANRYAELAAILPPLLRDSDALGSEGRAARAFLDPDLQVGKIQPADAYRVMEKDVVLSHAFAEEEVELFTYRAPGQANSYFYGYTKLIALRKDTEAALGTKFNQKKFHDFILAQGLLPPDLMRKAVMEDFVPKQ